MASVASPPYPPAIPPGTYTPLGEDLKKALPGWAILLIVIGGLVVLTAAAVAALRMKGKGLDTGVVSKTKLSKLGEKWGSLLGKRDVPAAIAGTLFVVVFLVLGCVGMPTIELDRGTAADWTPKGGRFEKQLREWDANVDNSVTDRTNAYIQISSDTKGTNLLNDAKTWLGHLKSAVEQVYTSATTTATDSNGNTLTLGWKDFCYSINHPILTGQLAIPTYGLALGATMTSATSSTMCSCTNALCNGATDCCSAAAIGAIIAGNYATNGATCFYSPGTGNNLKPCINPSVLDPFVEGAWEFDPTSSDPVKQEKWSSFLTIARVAAFAGAASPAYAGQVNFPYSPQAGSVGAPIYPSYTTMTNQQIVDRLIQSGTPGVGHWIAASTQSWGHLFGSYVGDANAATPTLTSAKSFVYTLFQDIPQEVIKFRSSVLGLSATEFRDANERWLLAMEGELKKINDDEVNFPNVRITYFPSNAISRMYAEVASAQTGLLATGYCLMLAFVLLTQLFGPWSTASTAKSAAIGAALGLGGFISVLIANAGAYGVIALAGVKYNHTMTQALPFLALGLGVNDLFLLLHAFKRIIAQHRGHASAEVIGKLLEEAGASVTITSVCNMAVFFLACLIPIKALQSLLFSAGLIIFFNWVAAMTAIPFIFAIYAKTQETADKASTPIDDAKSGADATTDHETKFEALFRGFYAKFAGSMPLKAGALLLSLGLLVAFASMISQVEMGFRYEDLAKRGSYIGEGIKDMYGNVYSQQSNEAIVFGTGIDYETSQEQIIRTHQAIKNTAWTVYGTAAAPSTTRANTWLENMYQSTGICPHLAAYGASSIPTDPAWAFYEDFHLWRKAQITLVPRAPSELAFGSLFAQLLDGVNSFPYSLGADDYTTRNKIVMSWDEVAMDMSKLQTSDSKIQMVKDFKKITEDSGLNIYMYGWNYVMIEQFINLEYFFWVTVGISMIVVMVCSLLLGISFVGAALIAFFSMALCLEVYGSLYVFGVDYQTLAATSVIASIGVSVEFVAHTVAAFEFASGSRDQRLGEALSKTGIPVFFGSISSLLGFLFMAFSDFDFVVKYFFNIFLMICVFGTINGLLFLPALLGLLPANAAASSDTSTSAKATLPKTTSV